MTEADDIRRRLGAAARGKLERLETFAELASTNSYLLQQAPPAAGHFTVAIAHHQTAGRGRDGKLWLSPPDAGLSLSIAGTFAEPPRNLPSLTLAVGIGVAKALQALGVPGLALKWPNDLIVNNAKLGGILTETQSEGGSERTVVVGVGINVSFAYSMRRDPPAWTVPITDLAACLSPLPSRPVLTASVIEGLIEAIGRFDRESFEPFRAEWAEYDWLSGKLVSVHQAQGPVVGIAEGIDEGGALRVSTDAGVERIVSGSVQLPLAAIET